MAEQKESKTKSFLKSYIFKYSLIIVGFILTITIILGAIFGVVVGVAEYIKNKFDFINKIFSSPFGLNSSQIYGARTIYLDDEMSTQKSIEINREFTYKVLLDLNSDSDKTSNINLDKEQESEIVTNICKTYLNKIVVDFYSQTSGLEIEKCAEIIDHFGLNDGEISIFIDSVAETIKNNFSNTEISDLNTKVTASVQKFNYIKNICSKVFIQDFVSLEDEGVQNLGCHNYVGYIFMPKKNITIKSTSFAVLPQNESTINLQLKKIDNGNMQNVGQCQTADSSWIVDEDFKKMFECNDINQNVSLFNAIDIQNVEYLQTKKTVFDLLRDDKYNIYFKEIADKDYSAINLLQNIKQDNYLYLETSSIENFNIVEYETTT